MARNFFAVVALVAMSGCTQPVTSVTPSTAAAVAVSEPAEQPQAEEQEQRQPALANAASDQAKVDDSHPAPPAATPKPTTPAAQQRTAAKPVVAEYADNIPTVLMTAAERSELKAAVGDPMPAIELPKAEGGSAPLESLAGEHATVVLFWGADRWMSHTALADLAKELAPERQGVAAVGVAVGLKSDAVAAEQEKAGARFQQLLDADGKALAQLGAPKLPRVYVLDAAGKIAWFDVEYSEATRRELHDAVAALAPPKQ